MNETDRGNAAPEGRTVEPNNDLDRIQRIIGEWGSRTFPQATNDSIAAHLEDEAMELREVAGQQHEPLLRSEKYELAQEAADCLLLLLHLAHRNGFSLFDAAAAKFAVNERRTWQAEPNDRGYMGHVETAVD